MEGSFENYVSYISDLQGGWFRDSFFSIQETRTEG